jgi:pyruvate,water dikinase
MNYYLKTFPLYLFTAIFFNSLFFFGCDKKQTIINSEIEFECKNGIIDSLPYIDTLSCLDEYSTLGSTPLIQTSGQISSIKVIYEIKTNHLFYVPSKKFSFHYDFCQKILNYTKGLYDFNEDQYSNNENRLYYLGTVSHYLIPDIYTLEFFPDDKIPADGIETMYKEVSETSYFGDRFYFMPTSTSMDSRIDSIKSNLRIIHQSDIFKDQQYQALNCEENYGYLRKIDLSQLPTATIGPHDILVINGIPNDIPAISGIVTTVFQSPLSHINVLSHNRKTPNMAFTNAWTDTLFIHNNNKLVYLSVMPDSFVLHEASIKDADVFWKSKEPSTPITLECNDTIQELFNIADISHNSISFVGAKAANLGELARIEQPDPVLIHLPEGAFAIPFYYYRNHLKCNNIEPTLDTLLNDSLSVSDIERRKVLLENLRLKIISAPIDPDLVTLVEAKIRALSQYNTIRFRSSTNAEDLEGFNGAVLYESYSAELGNPKETIGDAIKQVYAGMWTLEGFNEREYFKIKQRSAAMGILVHRSFPDELANGVAITKNIYNPDVPAFTINSQIGETSVVNPPQGTISDQLLFFTIFSTAFTEPAISYLSYSNLNHNNPVLNDNEIVKLAKYLKLIHDHFYYNVFTSNSKSYYDFAMDVEFKINGPDRDIYIKQARPY